MTQIHENNPAGLRVWLDDERHPPPGWTAARCVAEALDLLSSGAVAAISLDHDLGEEMDPHEGHLSDEERYLSGRGDGTGYAVCLWLLEHPGLFPPLVFIHSANPVGRERMRQVLSRHAPEGVQVIMSPPGAGPVEEQG